MLKGLPNFIFNFELVKCNALGMKLAKKRVNRLLDLGCGDGKLTMEFADVIGCNDVFGVDIIDSMRKQAEKQRIRCFDFDLNSKWDLQDNYFDTVLSSQNIEHLHNTRMCLEESYRCLKTGGQIIVLTENLASWANIFSLFFGWQPFSTTNINGWSLGNPFIWHKNVYKDEAESKRINDAGLSGAVGHNRVLSYQGLKDLLQKSGFENVRVFTVGYLPFWGWLSDLLVKIDRRHGHFLIGIGEK